MVTRIPNARTTRGTVTRARITVAVLAASLIAAACGDDGNDTSNDAGNTTTTASATATFPVTVEAANGTVTIDAQPERIVSLSPAATEMLFAIGAGDQVVAADEFSTFPEEAPDTSLSGLAPNIEAIASYEPDLVIAENAGISAELATLEIPFVVEQAAATLDDVYAQLEQLGTVTGRSEEAVGVVEGMRADIAEIVADVPARTEPLTYYHELDDTYYSVTSHTFVGETYALAGLENIADAADDGSGYPQLSAEYIIEQDPDLIFLADTKCCGQSTETLAARPGWGDLSAVRNDHVVELDDDVASRWGPRVVLFLRAIVDATVDVGT